MYVDPKGQIAGVHTLIVRDFLRRSGDFHWDIKYASQLLGLSEVRAKRLVSELLKLGYIEAHTNMRKGKSYSRTLAGSTFSEASAARPLKRETARQKLEGFLQRVREVNESEYFLYKVKRVLVFGSYLQDDRGKINDIDVAVELVHRECNPEKRQVANKQRIDEAFKAGRQFRTIIDEMFWPYHEVLLFLKARSRAISLHTTDDGILKNAQSQVVFETNGETSSA
ncbi:MAG: hypothetical protein L0387_05765 [Acidobacteria bacterium]|nr:hypothetical protein [Acidobacteriota bacterium]MCI0722697.1 hypothetical protein [Acidobacteriota bacterium]